MQGKFTCRKHVMTDPFGKNLFYTEEYRSHYFPEGIALSMRKIKIAPLTRIKNRSLLVFALSLALQFSFSARGANTITRDSFNFGHQLGYMYSRMDNAYFKEAGNWSFETGLLSYYTPTMPLVRNPLWKERTIVMIPLCFIFSPCRTIELQADLTDLFIEFPYQDLDNAGGKSPRFRTKIRLLEEKKDLPAIAFTVGVKFSSAKPYTIWANRHNYDESNGLAGAGTGVADYLLLFTCSKRIADSMHLTARIGLAPIGSPVEYTRGSAQADEIPYGFQIKRALSSHWASSIEVSGMYNGLPATRLAHYSVARLQFAHTGGGKSHFVLDIERGLTRETDTWVAGFYEKWDFKR
jgi:hypothetical protein